MMKKTTLAGTILIVSLASGVAVAAPTVTFQGEVTAQTCDVSVNGHTNAVVLLPTVANSLLSTSGQTAGLTPFTVNISNCSAPAADTAIQTNFLGYNVSSAGNMSNMATSAPATNVEVQLTDAGSGGNAVTLSGVTPVDGLILPAGETSASYQFGVQYYATGQSTPGPVTAVAEYSLTYP